MTMAYRLGKRSKQRLQGLHKDLVAVVERAIEITEVDFTVLEGMRTLTRQKELVAKGASTTLNSRHLTADGMKQSAKELEVDVDWGGDWKSFPDGPHYQLAWGSYPK